MDIVERKKDMNIRKKNILVNSSDDYIESNKTTILLDFLCSHLIFFKSKVNDITFSEWDMAIEHLTRDQLRIGCEYVANKVGITDITPNFFKCRCFGIIDTYEAYELAKNNIHYDKVIYNTVMLVGKYKWNRLKEDKQKSEFIRSYATICERLISGKSLSNTSEVKEIENKGDMTTEEWKKMMINKYGDTFTKHIP